MQKFSFTKNTFNSLLPPILEYISLLDEGEYSLTIDKKKKARSIRANNYSWALTDKLSEKLLVQGVKLSKDEAHAEMIFRYGQPLLDKNGMPVIISTCQDIKITDFYDYAEFIGESELKDKTFKHYKIYVGSHLYSSEEMSKFIAGIVLECKEQGIETETEEEIARMISLMEYEK